MKKIYAICWRFYDKSNFGIVEVWKNKLNAEIELARIKTIASRSGQEFYIQVCDLR